jgi:hypothetical protein
VITAVAFAPAVAAHAASPGSVPAQKGGPSCELEQVGKKASPTYNLVLEDFPKNTHVRAESDEETVSDEVNKNGDWTFRNVEYGAYTASYKSKGQTKKVPCETPPPPKDQPGAVDVIDFDLLAPEKPADPVDCAQPVKITAKAVIKAKGKGTVSYQWTTRTKAHVVEKATFAGPGPEDKTVTKAFEIPAGTFPANTDATVPVKLAITNPPGGSDSSDIKFKCKA